MITVYTTCKNGKEAECIAKNLLKNKIVACVNIFPVNSMYIWKNKLTKEREIALLLKTNKSFTTVAKEIKKLHSYEVPCIEKINVEFNKEYKQWIKNSLTK